MSDKKRYKYKSLKNYCSRDWLIDQKKYQKVFIDEDTDWIYGELAFYNILFDEEEWTCKLAFECYQTVGSKQEKVFSYDHEQVVKKDENIVYYRDGWGRKDKTFWKKGTYVWKAFIDDVHVGSADFYVEDNGLVTPENNPYFDIESIKFFESGNTRDAKEDRTYYTQFKGDDTRYLYTEFNLTSKISTDWHCELMFFYYDSNGRLMTGNASRYQKVTGNSASFSYGWGNEEKNIWKPGDYTVEVLFMNTRIAIVPFRVADSFETGEPQMLAGETMTSEGGGAAIQKGKVDEKSLDELLEDLDTMIGLSDIKTQIRDYINFLKFEKIREDKGLQTPGKIKLHTVLTGNPGTGKTTVAKQLGKIYKAMGLLTRGHVHEVDRADLVGEYIGQTAPKVKTAIDKARGGILFIDEAYALHREDSKNDYGQEVIEILLKEMSDGMGNIVIVAAGYPEEMNRFINSNPGLKSRFTHFFRFPDYVPDELMEIAELALNKRKLAMNPDAREFLFTKLTQAFRARDKSFGNARYVMSLVDEAKMNMALRLVKLDNTEELDEKELSTVHLQDVQKIFLGSDKKKLSIQTDTALLKDSLNELDTLIGMNNIKNEIKEIVKLVKYYNEIGKDVLNQFVLHTVFTGNPGTGKTTIARIYAKIFKALGIIERGHLVECDREGLVAGYQGQTAIKTSSVIDSAIGGVLFIDEAYSLVHDGRDAFGMEAINVLLKRMEDNNKDFILIAAGYPDNMHEFLKTNPGLKSRFEKTIMFEDYTPEELIRIATVMFQKEDLTMNPEAEALMLNSLIELHDARDEFFGNARVVRKIVQQAIRDHNLRMADLPADQRTMELITSITPEDLINLPKPEKNHPGGRPIGFYVGQTE